MAVTAERFNEGMTYQQYVDQMTQNKERFLENYEKATVNPEDMAYFANLPEPVHMLVIAEDWCGDVIAGLPVLGKLLDGAGDKLNVRVFLRDQNEDIMNQYLKEGQYKSIPVFVAYDAQMHELGYFIERPAALTSEMQKARNEFFAAHPELGVGPDADFGGMSQEARQAMGPAMNSIRAERGGVHNQMLVDELKQIATPVAA